MKISVYPGTFDPITNGHIDILERAAKIFDRVIITVAKNPGKKPLFSNEERVFMIQQVIGELDNLKNVEVKTFDGLIVDFVKTEGASVIIRGLRAISDFEYELQMALINRRLSEEITTVFLMPHEKYTYLNSSIVKEVASFGGDISKFVPPIVQIKLKEKLR